jgi:hypothetical protein
VFATFARGYEVVLDFLSRRYALSRSRGKSTSAPEKTMRALRNLLLALSIVFSSLWDDELITN